MSIQNPLLSSILIVGVFWYALLFLLSGEPIWELPSVLLWSVGIASFGAIAGTTLFFFARTRTFAQIKDNLTGASARNGISLSIGALPYPPRWPRKRVSASLFRQAIPAWDDFRTKTPKHAALMVAGAEVINAAGLLPASPVPGGHGGASLMLHSMNVVRIMRKVAPGWKYEGHKNKKGEVTFPLLDTTRTFHAFTTDDPILTAAAFLHDIGKVACYEIEDGRVKEVRDNHDSEGAKILRGLPELWDLPREDAIALLIAVGYYHHPGQMPASEWITDRTRSLTELLAEADIATGKAEGGQSESETESDQPHPVQPDPIDGQGATESGSTALGTEDELPHVTSATDTELDAPLNGEDPFGLFVSILLEPNRVNGRNAAARVAFKHGDWIYVSDAKLRRAVSERTEDSSLMELPNRGVMHPWTLTLMEELHAKGALKVEHQGAVYSPRRAVFNTLSRVEGHPDREDKFVIVVSTSLFPALARIPDCKAAPEIAGCSWGGSAAMNKAKQSIAATDGEAGSSQAGTDANLDDFLRKVARLESAGPSFVERVVEGGRYAFFDAEEVVQAWPNEIAADNLPPGTSLVQGGSSGKWFYRVSLSSKSVSTDDCDLPFSIGT